MIIFIYKPGTKKGHQGWKDIQASLQGILTGDKLFLEDRELLESNNFSVDEIVTINPSIDAGKVFFGYFLQ